MENIRQQTAIDYKERVCQAMNFISQNLHRDLSIEEIAQTSSFSTFHFHRIFKAVVGETIAGFTRRLRVELAANRLILCPKDDITTISIEYGFSSSQNFAKAFRQHFKMSPTEYRNSKIGNKVSKKEKALSLQAKYTNAMFMNILENQKRTTVNVEVKEMPEYSVAYVRIIGPYDLETCAPAFVELMNWMMSRAWSNPFLLLGIYWDHPEITLPEKCRFDACVTVPHGTKPNGLSGIQTISGGLYAVCHFETLSDGFKQAWEDAFVWLVNSGYECDEKPTYEVYHNNGMEHPEGKWIYDICIPLKGNY